MVVEERTPNAQTAGDTDAVQGELASFEAVLETVQQIANGYCQASCLHVVTTLGVADLLGDTPRPITEMAAAVGAHPGALGRVLRLLVAHGVFTLQGDAVGHSPASRLLRADHPRSLRDLVRLCGQPIFWRVYPALEHAVRTGRPATETALPEGFFGYYAQHPDEAAVFDAAMAAKAQGHVAGILAAYDFSGFRRIADIGGGRGHLLRAVLDAAPSATGVLFDLPYVITQASPLAADRLILQAGDFFQDALPTCDAYLLMEILHDWGDDEALTILQAIRRSAHEGATLLVLEQMIPADPGPSWTKMVDIHMLALLGGRQRTSPEYAALLAAAGFALQREVETYAGIAILEARAL